MSDTRARIVDEVWTQMVENFRPIEAEFLNKYSEVIAAVTGERNLVVRGVTLSRSEASMHALGGIGTISEAGFSAVTSVPNSYAHQRKLRTYQSSSNSKGDDEKK